MEIRNWRMALLIIGGCAFLTPPAIGQKTRRTPAQQEIDRLVRDLKSPDSKTRLTADLMLGSIGPDAGSATPRLVTLLKNKSGDIRASAAAACYEIGPSAASAAPALIKALRDTDPNVRRIAAAALGRVGSAAQPVRPRWRKP